MEFTHLPAWPEFWELFHCQLTSWNFPDACVDSDSVKAQRDLMQALTFFSRTFLLPAGRRIAAPGKTTVWTGQTCFVCSLSRRGRGPGPPAVLMSKSSCCKYFVQLSSSFGKKKRASTSFLPVMPLWLAAEILKTVFGVLNHLPSLGTLRNGT